MALIPKKAIVTTTINPPTKALLKFVEIARRDSWFIFVVGDKKTPHGEWRKLEAANPDHIRYIGPVQQEAISPELSELIGWNCIQRRNFGFIEAFRWGAEIIATVDDDNIPFENWGQDLLVGQEVIVPTYSYKPEVNASMPVFDPLAPTSQGCNMWHRGFPIQRLKWRTRLEKPTLVRRKVMVQADLWNGDPDIDAVCRITTGPIVKFTVKRPYAGEKPGPFNSQNTFLHRDVMPFYFMWPGIGRMDDIWAAYYLQRAYPDSVVYGPASVYQHRNEHDLVKDLEAEMVGYKHTLDFINWCYGPDGVNIPDFLPAKARAGFMIYKGLLSGS